MMCIVATPCCGGCECQPVPCNPADPYCPDPATCVDDGGGKGHCAMNVSPKAPGGFMDKCATGADCLQEYFCQQTMFCIAPPPGSTPSQCDQKNCVPQACTGPDGDQCPEGSTCVPYDMKPTDSKVKTCVRGLGGVPPPGSLGAKCVNSKECVGAQYFCVDTCPGMCIVPALACVPLVCDITKPECPEGAECEDVGITDACVRKAP